MHCENGRDKEPVEEYCCAVCQLANRLWDPPLFRPQHDGPRSPGNHHVPQLLCRLLHHGRHRCGILPGAVPGGGPDGTTGWPSHVHDHHCSGITVAAGPAQLAGEIQWPSEYRKLRYTK